MLILHHPDTCTALLVPRQPPSARPLPKEHVAKLSPDAKRTRKRAQIRMCKLRARRVKALLDTSHLTPIIII
jgi:hypothetical protein